MKNHCFLFVFLNVFACVLYGQNSAKIHLSATTQSSQIRLRWAVDHPLAWQLANRYGYTLERFEILDHQAIVDEPERRILNVEPIKPADSAAWQEKFDTHQSYAILAQALFGEEFQVSFQANHTLFQAFDQMQQDEQRYSIALLAADQCFDAACMAGLGWIDSTANPQRTYLYRIYLNVPNSLISCDTAKILINPSLPTVYPKIAHIFAENGNKSVFLSWNIQYFQGVYNHYIIEKSTDKKHFVRVENAMSSNISEDGKTAFFIDTLETNGKSYYYRISGATIFETYGPVSDPVEISGKADFTDYPKDLAVSEKGKNVVLQWSFEEHSAENLAHFLVFHQTHLEGEKTLYSRVSTQKRNCSFKKSKLAPSNYFTVVAVYQGGQERSSFAHFYQVVDSLPPSAPRRVWGVADSSGAVKLCWQKNPEKDLNGYRIFRSNQANQEVVQISTVLCLDTIFYDTLSINTAKSVYYQVVAVDKRGNSSDFSARAEVERVNKFPSPASFEDSVAAFSAIIPKPLSVPKISISADRENRQIVLNWRTSYTIFEMQIFRKKDDEDWYLLTTFAPTSDTYQDTKLELNSTYRYRLKCTDETGNRSPVSAEIRVVY